MSEAVSAQFLQAVERLRGHYAAAIATSGVVPDTLWNKPCIGYNVQYALSASDANSMAKIQRDISRFEPASMIVCPPNTLHVSVAWILAAKTDYGRPKNELWAEIDQRCASGLRAAAAAIEPFMVSFNELVVTDTAVIAVGEDGGSMAKLRSLIAASMPIPDATRNSADIVHVTLLRYARHFEPRAQLIDSAAAYRFHVVTAVDRVAIVQEAIYPSLKTTMLFSAPLGAR